MSTFVLVHGAWTGAHGWRSVRRLLAAAGHAVFTPSLTGIGERAHLTSPQVDLTTHVQDVVNQVLFEDLRDVVLVGFSYGGAVVTAALEHIDDRVRQLVYLDAFVPSNGQSVTDLAGRDRQAFTTPGAGPGTGGALDIGAHPGSQWLVPPPDRRFADPAEGAWQTARRVPHPARCFRQPVLLAKPVEEYACGLTYIKASADSRDAPSGGAFWDAAEHARASPRWRYHEIETSHMVASNRPEQLAAVLEDIGAGRA